MNAFFELLKTRHSIRKYKPIAVEQDKIQKLLKAALMSPASKRRNPWEFIVIENKETLSKLAQCKPHGSQMLKDAALAIAVLADTNKSDLWLVDASIASIIIQLQAHDLGLGSCWVQIHNREKDDSTSAEQYIQNILNIPQNLSVLNIISIGYPDEQKQAFNEDQLPMAKIHIEKFSL